MLPAHERGTPVGLGTDRRLPRGARLARRTREIGRPRRERGILPQDLFLEAANLLSRGDAQLGRQHPSQPRGSSQRLGLPPAPVEAKHEGTPATLPKGVRGHELARPFRHEVGRTKIEVSLEQELGGVEPQLVQPSRLLPSEPHPFQTRQRLPGPQGQCLLQQSGRRPRTRGTDEERSPSLRDQPIEPGDVDPFRIQRQQPTRRSGQDRGRICVRHRRCGEHAPQTRHIRLEAQSRARRRLFTPELVHQAIQRHDASGVQSHQREHATLL